MNLLRTWKSFQNPSQTSQRQREEVAPLIAVTNDEEVTLGIKTDVRVSVLKEQLLGRGSYTERIRFYLDRSVIGRWWDVMDVVLNLCFVASYIHLTYFSVGKRNQEEHPPPAPESFLNLEAFLAFLLLVNWLPSIYLAFDPWNKLFFDFFSLLSLFSTIPPLVIWTIRSSNTGIIDTLVSAGDTVFFYPFRFWRLHYSLMRILQPDPNAIIVLGKVARKATQLGVSIISTLSTVTAWVHICLYRVQHYYDLTFFDVFYTITVTATSGLSTEIVPDNIFSRVITIYVVVIGAIFIPKSLTDLVSLFRSQSAYLAPFKLAKGFGHIVIIGDFEEVVLKAFLQEFFCKDHGPITMRTRVALLSNNDPNEQVQALLESPFYKSRVWYIKGNTLSFNSMAKAKIESALACFIFRNTAVGHSIDMRDAVTVTQALAVRKYRKDIDIFAETLKPESRLHLVNITKEVVCISEFKMSILAQSAVCPGFSTLIFLLTTSVSDPKDGKLMNIKTFENLRWAREYLEGSKMEIYGMPLSDAYAGYEFSVASRHVFKKYNAVFFALKINTSGARKICLNPHGYILKGVINVLNAKGEMGYFITKNARTANEIAMFGPDIESDLADDGGESLPSPLDSRRPTVFLYKEQGSQEDIIPINATDTSHIMASTGGLEDLDLNQTPKSKGKLKTGNKVEEVKDHILLCFLDTFFPEGVSSFMATFRTRDPSTPVLILCPNIPDPHRWKRLERYKNLHYVQGTALSKHDLTKANIETALKAIIFAKNDDLRDRAVDSPALVSVLTIQSMCAARPESHKISIIVEFIYVENMKFIGKGDMHHFTDTQALLLIPAFVSGQVFSPSIFQYLLCQIYYNNDLMEILRGMVLIHKNESAKDNLSKNHGRISQKKISSKMVGQTYLDIFTKMISGGDLCIGLYRRDDRGSDAGVWFVSLNPDMNTVLQKDDSVFILSAGLSTTS